MQDRPGGLVRAEPEFALDLHRADAVLGGRDQPGGMEPRDERRLSPMKDRSGRDARLLAAPRAAKLARADVAPPSRVRPARRALPAVRVLKSEQKVAALLLRREPLPELQRRLRIVLARTQSTFPGHRSRINPAPDLNRISNKKNWSPQQISAWLVMTYPDDDSLRVSPETIYLTLVCAGTRRPQARISQSFASC